MPGRVEAIWIKRRRRGPMDAVESAQAVADSGLAGNMNQGGRRQVTILSTEAWEAVQERLGVALDPGLRRANLLVSGIDLEETRDRVLELGSTAIRILGETTPCNLMEETCPGLLDALAPHWRGGVYGVVLRDGEVSVGDVVSWKAEERS
jgi:MOSC domain-containing protein YiiM